MGTAALRDGTVTIGAYPMKKSELVKSIAIQAKISERQADEVLTALVESIVRALSLEQSVKLGGFGLFAVISHKRRLGRHPKTGQEIVIPGHLKPVFRPSSRLKSILNSH